MRHIVFVPLSIVSHTRSELRLAWNLLCLDPGLRITWITTSYGFPTLRKELALQSADVKERVQTRWSIVELHDELPSSNASFEDQGIVEAEFKRTFHQLLADGPPTLVIFDLARPAIISSIRELCAEAAIPRIPALAMMPTMAFTAFRFIVPNGGILENISKNRDVYIQAGLTQRDASMKAWRDVQGKLLRMPGLPPMYDYEITPQSGARSQPPDCDALNLMYRNAQEADGTVWLSTPEIEEPILAELSARLGKPALGVGCQLDFDRPIGEVLEEERQIFDFLQTQQTRYGRDSVLYISFGTLFWPNDRPDIIDVILDTLLSAEPPIPFVFATAFSDRIPAATLQRVSHSGTGLCTPWAPQQKVLEHPAVGIFLCHCGIGAVMEAILSLTPFIALPFGSEQPLNAAYYTQTHHLGIALHQFASDSAGLPLGCGATVTGTRIAMVEELTLALHRLQGDERRVFRSNMEEMRALMRRSNESGRSLETMLSLSRWSSGTDSTPPSGQIPVARQLRVA